MPSPAERSRVKLGLAELHRNMQGQAESSWSRAGQPNLAEPAKNEMPKKNKRSPPMIHSNYMSIDFRHIKTLKSKKELQPS